jgi:DNA polymerase III epsilon subunit-like protein
MPENTPHHLFGNMYATVDVETTGLDPSWNEIVQLACVPLNADLEPLEEVLPFNMFIKPLFEERLAPELQGKKLYRHCIDHGYPAETVFKLFEEWHSKLPLSYGSYGKRNRLVPIGHNYPFDMAFLKTAIGATMYDSLFHFHFRDTMISAAYVNDIFAFQGKLAPYSKLSLTQLCQKLEIEQHSAHDALDDCYTTAKVYRKMIKDHPNIIVPL